MFLIGDALKVGRYVVAPRRNVLKFVLAVVIGECGAPELEDRHGDAVNRPAAVAEHDRSRQRPSRRPRLAVEAAAELAPPLAIAGV